MTDIKKPGQPHGVSLANMARTRPPLREAFFIAAFVELAALAENRTESEISDCEYVTAVALQLLLLPRSVPTISTSQASGCSMRLRR